MEFVILSLAFFCACVEAGTAGLSETSLSVASAAVVLVLRGVRGGGEGSLSSVLASPAAFSAGLLAPGTGSSD